MFTTLAELEARVVQELSPWDGGYDVEAIARELEDTYHLVGGRPFESIPAAELADVVHTYDLTLTEV
jgi:hypothetical protein